MINAVGSDGIIFPPHAMIIILFEEREH